MMAICSVVSFSRLEFCRKVRTHSFGGKARVQQSCGWFCKPLTAQVSGHRNMDANWFAPVFRFTFDANTSKVGLSFANLHTRWHASSFKE